MKLKIRWWLCLFLAPVVSYSQEILSQPEAKLLAQFPFQLYSGGVVIIRGTLEGTKDTLQFILDTGSGGISLDSSTCVQHNIPMQLTDTTIKGIGGIRKVSFVFDKTLHLPGLKVDHLNFHVNNYDVLSSVYGEKIDGIIGYSFFIRYIVKLDFDRMIMEVYSPGKISYPRSGAILHPILSFLPIQYMQVRDRRKINFNFFLDTGAGLCFLMSEDFARDSAVLLPKRKPLVTQA